MIFLNAEDDAGIQCPRKQVVLTTNDFNSFRKLICRKKISYEL